MTAQPEVLVFGVDDASLKDIVESLSDSFKITSTNDLLDILNVTKSSGADICLMDQNQGRTGLLLEVGGLLQHFPEAVLLLNTDEEILWANQLAFDLLELPQELDSLKLFDGWKSAEIEGPDFCPINTVLVFKEQVKTTIRVDEKTFYELTVKPIGKGEPKLLLATLRDKSEETLQQQKLEAIHAAGQELGDLQPEDLLKMTPEQRVDMLKYRVLGYTQELLEFETVEIRIIDHETQDLNPLLASGMQPEAEQRKLKALAEDNGVTGFVAATGRSYLCEDTSNDPLYLEGAEGARSSLTVPLMLRDEVLGTFNVESPIAGAFTQTDLGLLQLFCREVSVALNTLLLLMTEKASTAFQNTARVLCKVSDPVDEIQNDAAWILENQEEDPSGARKRLRRIISRTQKIRSLIVDDDSVVNPTIQSPVRNDSRQLKGKRVMIVDQNPDYRHRAQEIFAQWGCIVECAKHGQEALGLIPHIHYDLLIMELRPADMSGTQLVKRIRETHEHLPIALSIEFGYDEAHTQVKVRPYGVTRKLFKPFREDQLKETLKHAITPQMS